jgi:putative ABC transport system substrate-binding protein
VSSVESQVNGDREKDMKNKITVLVLSAMLFALCVSADAQQSAKIPRVGFLSVQVSPTPTTPNPLADAFRQGLRDLGYIEGKNILVEYRYAEGKDDLIPSHVAELVQIKVDVIVITSLPQIRAAKQATKTIPIVMVATVDPVALG